MARTIKCVVWDLDHTIWSGVLLEDERVTLRSGIADILEALDRRGILLSIASKNEYTHAMDMLRSFRLDDYFLYPQIHWNTKSSSIQTIAREMNIGIDAIAFIDDQPFERDEVASVLPDVLCIDVRHLDSLLHMDAMKPRFITDDARNRRQMMKADQHRKTAEASFEGPQEQFLASLEMKMVIHPAGEADLQRAEELTVRTNQLNSTGTTFTYDELADLARSPSHVLLVAQLTDRYGTYGKIGLALIEKKERERIWTIRLLLMSCRVMSRGVGSVMLQHIIRRAQQAGMKLSAEFIPTDRNRMMYMTYKFAGFTEAGKTGGKVLLVYAGDEVPPPPAYVEVEALEVSS